MRVKNIRHSPSRRNFCKQSLLTTAVAATGFSFANKAQAAQSTTKMPNEEHAVSVHYEWGTLKEVVCGIPNLVIPKKLPDVVYNYAPTEGIKFFEANLGKTLEEADPKTFAKASEQMDTAITILKKRGVTVHRPNNVTSDENAYLSRIFPPSVIQFFPRDPMLVIGNKYIETELFIPLRRRERFGIRSAIANRLAESNAQVVSMPVAIPTKEDKDGSWGPGPFLEGGDVFLFGKDIYVGNSGNASNSAGIAWLRQYLGAEYAVHEIKLTPKFLHLDCCLATPRPGLAVICREAFVDGLPDFLNDWKLIDVPFTDAKEKLACNGLVIDEKTIMISTGLDSLAQNLRNAGQEVIETPFDAITQYAGGFRCWHHPLVRTSKK